MSLNLCIAFVVPQSSNYLYNSSVESIKTDSSVERIKTDSSVESIKTDSSVESIKTDSSVESIKTDSSVESIKTDSSVESIKTTQLLIMSKFQSPWGESHLAAGSLLISRRLQGGGSP